MNPFDPENDGFTGCTIRQKMSSRARVSFEEQGMRREHDGASQNLSPTTGQGYFDASGSEDEDTHQPYGRRGSLSIRIPPPQAKCDMAFTALQYLPMPVLVLSSMKTVVLANEAMGRMVGIDLTSVHEEADAEGIPLSRLESKDVQSPSNVLYGTSMSALGIDLLQNGNPVFVAWEEFLDTVVDDASKVQSHATQLNQYRSRNEDVEVTPTDRRHGRSVSESSRFSQSSGARTEVHDAIVDVVFSTHRNSTTGLPLTGRVNSGNHIQAKMIISVWATEDEQYFTLTFTAASDSVTQVSSGGVKTTSRTVTRTPTSASALSSGSGPSSGSSGSSPGGQRGGSSAPTSSVTSPSTSEFLPKGPPMKAHVSTPTIFSKTNRLKDAILNSMSFPAYAMWKDESFGIPNKAAIKLIYPWLEDGMYDTNDQARDFLAHYILYNEKFTEQIPFEDFPILTLMREQQRFEGRRVGMYSRKDGSRLLYDVLGEPILDDKGEFLGGLVVFQDVTGYATTITGMQQQNERQFEDITNMIPQMIWRTTPEGIHDYYSQRWYSYTGFSVEESAGKGWANAFHADDLDLAQPRWEHCLKTGDEFVTEYRCRSRDGKWRWMLGRASPMRDSNDKILKWFGSCTDIHEVVLAREQAKQLRSQLLRVIEHAQITLWAVDLERRLTLYEGTPMYNPNNVSLQSSQNEFLDQSIYEIFDMQGRQNEKPLYEKPIEDIIAGRTQGETIEVQIDGNQKIYRTRLFPLLRQERKGGQEGDTFVDGCVGVR